MGYTTSSVHGIEVPNSAEANNVPEDIGKVVTALEAGSIVKRLTGAQISALTSPQKPAGLVVYNTTTGKLQVSNGSTFANIDAAALLLSGGTMTGDLVTQEHLSTQKNGDYGPRVNITDADGDGYTLTIVSGELVTRTTTSGWGITSTPATLEIADGTDDAHAATKGQVDAVSASFVGGVFTGTTDGVGDVTVTLPTSPTGNWAVTVTGTSVDGSGVTGYGQLFYVTAVTSTSATVRVARSSTGAYVNSTSVTFRYTAIAY